MRRLGTAAGIVLTALLFVGCGKGGVPNDVGTEGSPAAEIEIMKDGSIVETITEDFSKEYYDEESLKSMVLAEVAEFNKNSGDGVIAIDKFENKKGSLTIRMKYPSAEVYTAYNTDSYNDGTVFFGTVEQAYNSGYSLDVSLTSVKGEETIGKEELLSMGERGILIVNTPMQVKLPGRVLYVGEHVTAVGKNQVQMQADENGDAIGSYYVIF